MVEVLAAMVIFSIGAVVLFGWIGQTADRLGRISKEQAQLFSELAAIDYLRTLNPTRSPQGEQTIGEAKFRWAASPVGSEQPSRAATGNEGIYAVQLYKVNLSIDTGRGGKSERSLLLAGWRQVRSGAIVNPFEALGSAAGSAAARAAVPATAPAAPPTTPAGQPR